MASSSDPPSSAIVPDAAVGAPSLATRLNESLAAAFEGSGFATREAVAAMTLPELTRVIQEGVASMDLHGLDVRAGMLLDAAASGDAPTARLILLSGASPSVCNEKGLSALMLATLNHTSFHTKQHLSCATMLIEAKADMEARTPLGRTALHLTCESSVEAVRAFAVPVSSPVRCVTAARLRRSAPAGSPPPD